MEKKIDTIKPKKVKYCNNCIFCFSKCLNCGTLDITVEYCDFWHYKYRNKFMNHIYVTLLEKKSFRKSRALLRKPPLLKIDCNKCKNKITAIGELDQFCEVQHLYSYNRNNPSKYFRSNSKYYRQAKYLLETMADRLMMPTSDRSAINCDSFHVFIDDTESNSGKGHRIKTEWFSYHWKPTICTTNNFSYKRNPGRLKYMIKMKSDEVFYTKDGEVRPKLTALKLK